MSLPDRKPAYFMRRTIILTVSLGGAAHDTVLLSSVVVVVVVRVCLRALRIGEYISINW